MNQITPQSIEPIQTTFYRNDSQEQTRLVDESGPEEPQPSISDNEWKIYQETAENL